MIYYFVVPTILLFLIIIKIIYNFIIEKEIRKSILFSLKISNNFSSEITSDSLVVYKFLDFILTDFAVNIVMNKPIIHRFGFITSIVLRNKLKLKNIQVCEKILTKHF